MTNLMNVGLPKWPQMLVTGRRVTQGIAMEIIRRTDCFFIHKWGGNDDGYDKRVAKIVNMPFDPDGDLEGLAAFATATAKFDEQWGVIRDLEYVSNSWISNAYVLGPHGWVHPSGRIGYVDNIGKWPSVEDVVKEWKILASEFNFLSLHVTLMDREHSEPDPQPLVGILVDNGTVQLVDPNKFTLHKEHEPPIRGNHIHGEDDDQVMVNRFLMGDHAEHGIPEHWFDEWAKEHKAVL